MWNRNSWGKSILSFQGSTDSMLSGLTTILIQEQLFQIEFLLKKDLEDTVEAYISIQTLNYQAAPNLNTHFFQASAGLSVKKL